MERSTDEAYYKTKWDNIITLWVNQLISRLCNVDGQNSTRQEIVWTVRCDIPTMKCNAPSRPTAASLTPVAVHCEAITRRLLASSVNIFTQFHLQRRFFCFHNFHKSFLRWSSIKLLNKKLNYKVNYWRLAWVAVWLSGTGVTHINEVALRRAGLVLGWVTVRGYTI